MCYVGESYHLGVGVARDLKKAMSWYEKSLGANTPILLERLRILMRNLAQLETETGFRL
jgi:TPR repeat protein